MTLRDRRTGLRAALAFAAALTASATAAAAQNAPAKSEAYQAVDPFIGTGADGHTYPGAVVPFGMVQLSPDTWIGDFHHSYAHAAGYRYEDKTIQGFSHTHFSGAGHSDLGDMLVTRPNPARATARASATTARRPSPATTP
jgi:putative alpha-1,2-mannosidase